RPGGDRPAAVVAGTIASTRGWACSDPRGGCRKSSNPAVSEATTEAPAVVGECGRQVADPSLILIRSRGGSRGSFREARGSSRKSPLRVWAVPSDQVAGDSVA